MSRPSALPIANQEKCCRRSIAFGSRASATATGIFTLIEKGKLRFDNYVFGPDSVLGADYATVPTLQGLMKDGAGRSPNEQITIEHLLTHTKGAWPHGFHDPLRTNAQMTHRQLIAWTLENMPLTAPPGESFAYSNSATASSAESSKS